MGRCFICPEWRPVEIPAGATISRPSDHSAPNKKAVTPNLLPVPQDTPQFAYTFPPFGGAAHAVSPNQTKKQRDKKPKESAKAKDSIHCQNFLFKVAKCAV